MTLFNDDNLPTIDPSKDYLNEYVGDDKKFKTPQDLARAKAESDAFIERLTRENAGLREDLKARTGLEELVTRLSEVDTKPSADLGNEPQTPNREDAPDLEKIIAQKLEEREVQKTSQDNLAAVKKTLADKWGSDYSNKLKTAANELGVGEKFLSDMAAKNPKAFYKLVGLESNPRPDLFEPPPRTETTVTMPPASGDRDWDYYEKLRKADSNRYWSVSVQNQLHKDALRLGERFKRN
jgi:hypothetical protein